MTAADAKRRPVGVVERGLRPTNILLIFRRMIATGATRPIDFTAFEVEGYKAFAARSRVELGRITVLLGRNNSGKTALCFAPGYFARVFQRDAAAPFPPTWEGLDFGPLQSVCYRRRATGLMGALEVAGSADVMRVRVGATALAERHYEQFITHLSFEHPNGLSTTFDNIEWEDARARIATFSSLTQLPEQVRILRGVRPAPERMPRHLGYTPETVGSFGENAPMILLGSGDKGLASVNDWFSQLGARLSIEQRGDQFEILATGRSGEPVNLIDSGAGLAHVLPLVVATLLAKSQPSLRCIEQPELHMHPRAHIIVAELLLESINRHPGTRLLVETHSDVLVLRLRRAVASGALSPRDIRLYFVDEDGPGGSYVREIPLSDRATPEWWPKDVFAESQKEFFALRRALSEREGKT